MGKLKSIKNKIEQFRNWQHISFVFIFLSLVFISALLFALDRDLTPKCNFLACHYYESMKAILNVSGIFLFFPLLLNLLVNSPIIQILSLILLIGYWFLLSLIPSFIYNKTKKRPRKQISKENEKIRNFTHLGAFFIFFFFVFFLLTTFLYYPRTTVQLDFQSNVIISALIVGIITLFSKDFKNEYASKSLKALGLFSLYLLVFGLFTLFMSEIQIIPQNDANEIMLNNASINSIQIASVGAGITGLFFVLFFIMDNTPRKRNSR